MNNKEKKAKSWLDEDAEEIEGAEELHQAHARLFGGDLDGNVSMPVEEYRRRVEEFKKISDEWHKKHSV